VTFRVIPDAATRVAALLVNEVDLVQNVPLNLVPDLLGNPLIQVKTAPGTQPKWVDLNVKRQPFNQVEVRQGLNYAIDKERIIENVYGGNAVPLPGPLSPYNRFVNKALEPYPYNTSRALALLERAGWVDTDGDGFLDQDGKRFRFTLDTLPDWLPLAEEVATQLQEIGLDVSVRTWEFSIIKPDLLAGRRRAYLDDWGDSAFDPVGNIEAKWHGNDSSVVDSFYGRANYSGFNDPEVNELIRQGASTADLEERQRIYDRVQEIIYDQAPAVFLVLPEEVEAASIDLQDWQPASDSRINLHDICVNR
jgi:peptide/nickel transport system substrate-binding protein